VFDTDTFEVDEPTQLVTDVKKDSAVCLFKLIYNFFINFGVVKFGFFYAALTEGCVLISSYAASSES
jgi:hypothetical protein